MSEQTPEMQHDAKPKAQTAEETPQTPGVGYAYVDQTKEFQMPEPTTSEASHALLNPAFYPKDAKPEAAWTEAEKNDGAESPSDPTVPSAPGTDEDVELPEEFSQEAADERTKQYEEMAKKDIEAGAPVASTDESKSRTADEGEKEVKAKVGRKPKH